MVAERRREERQNKRNKTEIEKRKVREEKREKKTEYRKVKETSMIIVGERKTSRKTSRKMGKKNERVGHVVAKQDEAITGQIGFL